MFLKKILSLRKKIIFAQVLQLTDCAEIIYVNFEDMI